MSAIRLAPFSLLLGLSALTGALALWHAPARAADEGWWPWQSQTVAGSGKLATQARSVPAFQAISTAGTVNLKIRQGAREAVEVRTDDNLLALLETVVEPDGDVATLKIRWKRGVSAKPRAEATVVVDVVALQAIASSGPGQVTVDAVSTPALKVSLSGSGNARLNGLQTAALSIGIAGSGDVRADGKADRLTLSIAGSGEARLAGLRVDEASVSIAGSGDAEVNARKVLEISIAGSGDVVYSGDPSVSSSIAGSGRVSKR